MLGTAFQALFQFRTCSKQCRAARGKKNPHYSFRHLNIFPAQKRRTGTFFNTKGACSRLPDKYRIILQEQSKHALTNV